MKNAIQKYSAGGVICHNGKVLTIKWLSRDSIEFPKGTIEAGESSEQTAMREVLEETGYVAEIIQSLGSITFEFDWDDGKHYRKTVDYFLMNLVDESDPIPNRENGEDFENLWLDLRAASGLLTHDDSREILRRALELISQASL